MTRKLISAGIQCVECGQVARIVPMVPWDTSIPWNSRRLDPEGAYCRKCSAAPRANLRVCWIRYAAPAQK